MIILSSLCKLIFALELYSFRKEASSALWSFSELIEVIVLSGATMISFCLMEAESGQRYLCKLG